MNLTGLSSRKRILTELLMDSLIASSFLPAEGRLLDVGSGAGFPGIPLKICKPSLETLLVEGKSKKISFLKQVIRLTGLQNIQAMEGRIERVTAFLHPEGYHIITARALAHLPQVVKWCAPHVMPGGLLVNFQGSEFGSALKEGSDILKEHRLILHRTVPYKLPGKENRRNLLIFKKSILGQPSNSEVETAGGKTTFSGHP